VEKRRDGTVAIRFRDQYLRYQLCERSRPAGGQSELVPASEEKKAGKAGKKSRWMDEFFKKPGPSLRKAIELSNATS
jgi:hypothetical protein